MISFHISRSWSSSHYLVMVSKQPLKRCHLIHRDDGSNLEQALDSFQGLLYLQNGPDPVTITQKDIKALNPSRFLNDTIIDFYNKRVLRIIRSKNNKTMNSFGE